MKKWVEAIRQGDFEPIKTDVICSAHFTSNDYMDRPCTSGVRLKYIAVPSIFPISTINVAKNIPSLATLDTHIETTRSKSLKRPHSLEEDKENRFQSSENTSSTSADNAIKMTMIKKQKIMDNFTYHYKNQEISPRKKRMQTIINTLKQNLRRKEKTIQLQQNLLADLRYGTN